MQKSEKICIWEMTMSGMCAVLFSEELARECEERGQSSPAGWRHGK